MSFHPVFWLNEGIIYDKKKNLRYNSPKKRGFIMLEKTKANLLLLNIDLIPMTEKGTIALSKEEIQKFITGLNSLQQEKGLPILFCLRSDKQDLKTLQKGIQIYNALAPLLPMEIYRFGALELQGELFDPYKNVASNKIKDIYPNYDINGTIYMLGSELQELSSSVKEIGTNICIKGNSIPEWASSLNDNQTRKRKS